MFVKPIVASLSIDAITPEGEVFVILVEIGAPYEHEDGDWACSASLRGLYHRLADARGVDAFQVLCMAIALVQDLLQGHREKGGRLLVDGEDFPLEAYAFGAAIRRPSRS
jgi:hypothetical protein